MRGGPRVRLVAVTAVLVLGSLSCTGGADRVELVTEGAYPPYNFINDGGELDGFERELGDELCRRAELECEWVIAGWEGMIADLAGGKYDALITGVSITSERDAVIDFTQPYLPPGAAVFVARSGAGAGAAAGAVGAQVATIFAAYLSESGAAPRSYATTPELVEAVRGGELDAALVSQAVADEAVAMHPAELTTVGPALTLGLGTAIGVREEDGRLRQQLDEAIASMKDDGSLNALIRRWFGPGAAGF